MKMCAFLDKGGRLSRKTFRETAMTCAKKSTSSPGRFSLALEAPHLQSQGKAPWGQGCLKVIKPCLWGVGDFDPRRVLSSWLPADQKR